YTLIRNIFSRKNRFEVSDIHSQPAYQVAKTQSGLMKSTFTLTGEKSQIETTIERHYKSFKTIYSIFQDGRKIAALRRKLKLFRSYFKLEFVDGKTYLIKCDAWRKKYTFYEEEEVVAKLERKTMKMQRTYELTCLNMNHHEVLLASVVGLDQIFDQDGSG
ncbi:MAG: hypothetical protein AAF599_10910, partial [Bacteroidota bacterium]